MLQRWMRQLNLGDQLTISEEAGILMKEKIDGANGKRKSGSVIQFMQPMRYAAASILLVLTFAAGYFLLSDSDRKSPRTKDDRVVARTTVKFKRLINNSSSNYTIKLEDGSVIELSSGDRILYQSPFASDRRLVELSGRAFFTVAKNKHKPFIVLSGDITTTALGTSFWVDQHATRKQIEVRLVTGKVVVKQEIGSVAKTLAYLNPGQTLAYQENTGKAIVSETVRRSTPARRINNAQPELLIFENTELVQVFRRLQNVFKVKIEFTPDEVQSMSFYGTYSESDSVENILNTISRANGLTLTKENKTFIITK